MGDPSPSYFWMTADAGVVLDSLEDDVGGDKSKTDISHTGKGNIIFGQGNSQITNIDNKGIGNTTIDKSIEKSKNGLVSRVVKWFVGFFK